MENKKKLGMEFFGVMVIVMVAYSGDQHPMLTGLTAGLMYTMAMGISGGHLNPAITIGLMATKKMEAEEGGQYVAAQVLGAFAAFLMADIVLGNEIASAATTGGMLELWQDVAAMTFAGFPPTLAASNICAYWNGNKFGNAFFSGGSNTGTISMDASSARRITLGSAAHHYEKSGNNNETVYNDLTIYNKQLSDSEVTALYNSGTPTDATALSSAGNLRGYYTFENSDGTDSSGTSGPTFTVNGDSSIISV